MELRRVGLQQHVNEDRKKLVGACGPSDRVVRAAAVGPFRLASEWPLNVYMAVTWRLHGGYMSGRSRLQPQPCKAVCSHHHRAVRSHYAAGRRRSSRVTVRARGRLT